MMSNRRISDFTQIGSISDNDLILLSHSGTTYVILGSTLRQYAEEAGAEAAEITEAEINASGHLIITTSTGETIDAGVAKGADGTDGVDGEDGADGVSIVSATVRQSDYHLILTLSNGNTLDAGYCRGASGSGAGDMLASVYDSDSAVSSAGGIKAWSNANKADKITASGILKGDGSGGVSAAVSGTDYVDPSGLNTKLNRTTSVNADDASYTTFMARGESLNTSDTTPTANGTIAWTYE